MHQVLRLKTINNEIVQILMTETEVKSMTTPATLTPQNAFPLCGSLEDEAAIAQIGNLLLSEENGLKTWCISDAERWLCRYYGR